MPAGGQYDLPRKRQSDLFGIIFLTDYVGLKYFGGLYESESESGVRRGTDSDP